MIVPAIPNRATKLFQLLDFWVGGAVLMYRRAGATERVATLRCSAVERAINRGAARNIVLKGKQQERDKKRKSWRTLTELWS
jgi:hypothetical protein